MISYWIFVLTLVIGFGIFCLGMWMRSVHKTLRDVHKVFTARK